MTLPYVSDVELETLIEQRANTLVRQFDGVSGSAMHANQRLEGGRGQVVVHFTERKRRKGWFGAKADEEMIWETWILDVTLATPRTETGMMVIIWEDAYPARLTLSTEALKARRAMESSLQRTGMKVVNIVNRDRNHIPPITTNETNPFPYHILVNPKNDGWGQKMGIF